MKRIVIFDLDGVLIDSEQLMRYAFVESYRQVVGDGHAPVEDYFHYMGEAFTDIMDKMNLPHAMWDIYRAISQQHIHRIRLFPQVEPLLKQLIQQGKKLSILTGKDSQRTAQILEHYQINTYFEMVVCSDQLKNSKPHPEGILYILREFNARAEDTVMIGDTTNDILCAQQAGVQAVAVTWGIRPDLLSQAKPDVIVHDWDNLYQLLLTPRVEL